MKKTMTVLTLAALLAAGTHSASAGDREWATAGKILTGLVAAQVLSSALQPAPVYHPTTYYAPAPVYVAPPPPVYVAPAPVYVAPAPVVYPAPVVVAAPVYAPPPVVVYPAPVYYRPPVVSFSFSFGRSYYRPGCW